MWMCYKTPHRNRETEEVTNRILGVVETVQDLPDETERLRDREMAECGAADQTSQNVDHAGSVRVWRSHTHREELVLCWKQARLHLLISASLGIPLGSHLWSLEVYFVQFPWFFPQSLKQQLSWINQWLCRVTDHHNSYANAWNSSQFRFSALLFNYYFFLN